MSLFGRMFGGKDQHPDLDPNTSAAAQIACIEAHLEKLAKDFREPLEVVPGDEATYVFIGKPPKKFGVAWIEEDEVRNFQTLAKEKGVPPAALQKLGEKLRSAYEQNLDADRFTAHVGSCDITVTPCPDLKDQVEEIINTVTH